MGTRVKLTRVVFLAPALLVLDAECTLLHDSGEFAALCERFEQVLRLLSDALPGARVGRFWEAVATFESTRRYDRARYAAAGRQFRQLEPAHELVVEYRRAQSDMEGAKELAGEDVELAEREAKMRAGEGAAVN